MQFSDCEILGVKLIHFSVRNDARGSFVKNFNQNIFLTNNLDFIIKESYFSISHKNSIRGMHFQHPPFEHDKLIYVSNGQILDVILDLRKDSLTYGEFMSFDLDNTKGLFIPKGIAHGFKSITDNTIVNYLQSTVYTPSHDDGILFNSFGMDWGVNQSTIISKRDLSFKSFIDFESPF